MIKAIKITDHIVDITTKAASKTTSALENIPHAHEASALNSAGAELLGTYRGVKVKKLFASFPEFLENFKTKLESFKDCIPENLLQKLSTAADKNNFSLSKIISEHYAGLEKCKTLDDVHKLYPELKVPNMKFEEELTNDIKATVPKSICQDVQKLATPEEKQTFINNHFAKIISKQVESWEIYPELKKIQQKVTEEIINGNFIGKDFNPNGLKFFNSKMPIRYRFMHTQSPEEAYIQLLKEHYIHGKNITDISIKTLDEKEIQVKMLTRRDFFPEMDKHFRTFIKSSENNAKQFQELANLSQKEISSAVMTQTWIKSGLRRDLGNETAYKKDWSLIKPVWQKTMFPETTFYPTDKLVDTFLLAMFKNGKRQTETANPILKYLENPTMDKSKIMLLKRLYKNSKDIDLDKRILNSEPYKTFKAQFDLEGMAKSIENIEEHYKNAFFKRFWNDDRKLRFTNALNQNREIAGQNVELSEKILTDAMDNVFTDI